MTITITGAADNLGVKVEPWQLCVGDATEENDVKIELTLRLADGKTRRVVIDPDDRVGPGSSLAGPNSPTQQENPSP